LRVVVVAVTTSSRGSPSRTEDTFRAQLIFFSRAASAEYHYDGGSIEKRGW